MDDSAGGAADLAGHARMARGAAQVAGERVSVASRAVRRAGLGTQVILEGGPESGTEGCAI
jgi:hypothetical protein